MRKKKTPKKNVTVCNGKIMHDRSQAECQRGGGRGHMKAAMQRWNKGM